MGVKMDQIHAHVTTDKITHNYAQCNNHKRACPSNITDLVLTELKGLSGVESLSTLEKPRVKRRKIEGLKVIKDLFICDYDGCSSGYTSRDSLRQHRSQAHTNPTNKPKRGTYHTGYCQTLHISPATYFEVDQPISPPTDPLTPEPDFNLSAFLHHRKTEMLQHQYSKHHPTNPQMIPPPFAELGFYTFITSLDQSSIPGYMKYQRGEVFHQLQKLVIQCFKDDCDKLGPAHKSIRETIMENPPQYVYLFKLIPIINQDFTATLKIPCPLTPLSNLHSNQQHRLHMLLLKQR
jgi:hypothetical protein